MNDMSASGRGLAWRRKRQHPTRAVSVETCGVLKTFAMRDTDTSTEVTDTDRDTWEAAAVNWCLIVNQFHFGF